MEKRVGGVDAVGEQAFGFGFRVLDLMCLTDVHVGRARGVRGGSLELRWQVHTEVSKCTEGS